MCGASVEELLFLIVLLLAVAAFGLGCFLEKRAERKRARSSSVRRVNKPAVSENRTQPDAQFFALNGVADSVSTATTRAASIAFLADGGGIEEDWSFN